MRIFKKILAAGLCVTMCTGMISVSPKKAEAATVTTLGSGSIGTGVTSEMSAFASKLPTLANSGTIRYTTDNYNKNNGAIDTNNWGTCGLWNYFGNTQYTGSIYTYPMAYRADSNGMGFAHPATRVGGTYVVNTLTPNGTFTDFYVQPEFETDCSKVDNITDWTYDMVLENKNNSSQYLKTTMTQGSPFGFFQLYNSKTVNIVRNNPGMNSSIVYMNGSSLNSSTYIVVKTYKVYNTSDIKDQEDTPDYDYYGIFVPSGTKWTQTENTSNNVGTLKLDFESVASAYFSVAWLDESDGDNSEAINIAKEYNPYAYNFVTDTRADYSYDETTSSVSTIYKYIVDKKNGSTKDGTVMGIMPHQYKNMSDTSGFLTHTARTLRGNVKYKLGSYFSTKLEFAGVLPNSPDVDTNDKSQLQKYVGDFMTKYMPENGNYALTVDESAGDPYALGKQLNRSANVMAAAEAVEDTQDADRILNGLKKSLAKWFTYTGSGDTEYFTYDSDIGSLLSFPTSYDSIEQMNDHYFHYGYFIQAAAQVGLRDSSWVEKYGPVVEELINDIACPDRNSSTSRYPYLRNFSPFEGHSWASGFEDPECGNNQESTSEAMNAWYGIILFGMATGNDKIRDLGIYLYTTELSGIENYWFDVDGDVLDEKFDDTHIMASLIFGGKYDYATWFSADAAMVQGIQLLPITAGSYYLSMGKDYMKKYIASGNKGSWNDVWSEYIAMMDPNQGLSNWSGSTSEGGETTAHTYHFIKSLQKSGTPDTSITSNTPLSAVFVGADGEKTYSVYNTDNKMKVVSFSDGAKFTAKEKSMTTLSESDMEGQEYYVNYYLQQSDGSYALEGTDVKYGNVGDKVTAQETAFTGYAINKNTAGTVATGTITASGLTLKLYYDRQSYTVSYELNDGVNSISNPVAYTYGDEKELKEPTKEGYNFRGWYSDEKYTNKIEAITNTTSGNLKLYARWADANDYYINDDMHVSINGTSATFTVDGHSSLSSAIGYYKVFNNESDAITAAESKVVSGYAGVSLANENGCWTGSTSIGNIVGKYLVVTFNLVGSATDTGLSDWGCFKVTTAGAEIVTTKKPDTTTSSTTTNQGVETTSNGEQGTIIDGSYVDHSDINAWLDISNRTSLKYALISKEGSGNIGNINAGSLTDFYIPTGFVPTSIIITGPKLNNKKTVPANAGAEVKLSDSYFELIGYYTVDITDGNNSLSIAFKKGNPVIETTTSEKITTTAKPTTENVTTNAVTTNEQTESQQPTAQQTTSHQQDESQQTTSRQPTTDGVTSTNNSTAQITPDTTTAPETKTTGKVGKVKITKAYKKKKSTKAKVSLKKLNKVSGYEIQISTSKKFSKKKTLKKYTTKTVNTIKKLKAKKKYYVRVRAYRLVNKKKQNGPWSNIVKMKLTKSKAERAV